MRLCDFWEFHEMLMDYNGFEWILMRFIQDGAPKIAKLPYKWFNYGLW